MSPFPFTLVRDASGRQYLTIYTGDGELPPVVADDHPHFEALQAAASDPEATAADIRELADLSAAVAARFSRLSERVSVANGRVYFDGDELDNSITRHIVRTLDTCEEDWQPYVLFLENIAANPSEHSREQLFDWLRAHEFTITEGGEIVGYKGVARNEDGTYSPTYGRGYAIVDGERQEEIKQRLGSTVELPRSEVVHNPSDACSFGLHVGTAAYAEGYARGVLLKVAVNPRDVVSVPTDASGAKVRVCRYRVLEEVEAAVAAPIDHSSEPDPEGEVIDCEECGDPVHPDDAIDGAFCSFACQEEGETEEEVCEECGDALDYYGFCEDPDCPSNN